MRLRVSARSNQKIFSDMRLQDLSSHVISGVAFAENIEHIETDHTKHIILAG